MKEKLQICHIVPSNIGGGVEAAARSFMHFSCDKFIFNVYLLFNKAITQIGILNNVL